MQLVADGILFIAAVVAALYCMVLSARLRKLMQTEGGLGEAIASMSSQVDELNKALASAKTANEASAANLRDEVAAALKASEDLKALIRRAETLPATPVSSPEPVRAEPAAPPAEKPAEPREEPVFGELSAAMKVGEKPKREIDGIISAYIKSHSGEDEETIAKRLVSALADKRNLGGESRR